MVHQIDRMTRPQVEALLKEKPVLILPTGATEQHGAHLPMGTDNLCATNLAQRVGERLGVGVLPCLNFGYSWVWKDVLGSAVISHSLFEQIIVELAQNYARQGIKILAVINGHDANSAALKYACRRVSDAGGLQLLHFTYPSLNSIIAPVAESPLWHGMLHACEVETSLVRAIDDSQVDMSKAVCEYPEKPQLYGKSDIALGDISRSGVFGDATKATPEKGEAILAATAQLIGDDLALAMKQQNIL